MKLLTEKEKGLGKPKVFQEKIVLFIVLLIALTGCVKEEIIPTEEVPSEIKPAPGTELPEPIEPAEEETKEDVVDEEVKEEEPKEELVEEAPKEKTEENVVHIEIRKFEFVPAELKIAKGTKVIWTNTDDKAHIFRQVGTGFRSPIIKAGETFEHTFNEAEVFKFTELNYGQRGRIVVE